MIYYKEVTQTALNFKTYGSQGIARHTIRTIQERFKVNQYSKAILKKQGLKSYIPKLSKLRVVVGFFLVVGCLITPATNWLTPFIIGWVLK